MNSFIKSAFFIVNDFELARKIDDSTRVILEMALETTGISSQIPVPDS